MLLRQFSTRRNRCDRSQGGTLVRAITCFILSLVEFVASLALAHLAL